MSDTDQDVIHKLVVQLGPLPQKFTVPRTATLVAIGQDTREPAIAVWYRFTVPHAGYDGPTFDQTWVFQVAATGQHFPADARVLGTVVWPGYAWHLLDLDRAVRG